MKLLRSSPVVRFTRTITLVFVVAALLSACMVGPNFERPAAPTSQHYDAQAEHELGGANTPVGVPHVDFGKRVEGDWWSTLGSAKLDEVMHKAIVGNLDLEAADATIAQANEAVAATAGGLSPQAVAH
jgi:outer membrane protein TolC